MTLGRTCYKLGPPLDYEVNVERKRCPYCGEVDKHAERCPVREPPPPPKPKITKLEATVDEWAERIASDIPKPHTFGWKPNLPVQTADGRQIVKPDGTPVGMQSEVKVTKSGAELLWQEKLRREPCKSCAHYSREMFEDKDRAELAIFLQREAKWDVQAIYSIIDNIMDFGVCLAHSEGADKMHVTHKDASCLHLWEPKSKGWIKSFGSFIAGGSKRHGF